MNALSALLILSTVIATALMMVSLLLHKTHSKDREKSTPFECGFEPFTKARAPFSMRFFITIILFLIFDIEIALLAPLALLAPSLPSPFLIMVTAFIAIILLMGLAYEWAQGALAWLA